ncbi:3-phosphoserine/phosphohydroxythreonine transaminase [Leptospira bandrabouensis]|uniref:Phosphoserine aminotransferase n=1 Tax=Leptospira bandrabouensis TaxID=2484903 RepID=A0A6H3NZV7_9LEPT|nr:3-phosphoserine/phosphohydroxythreonine transaminase [Leptospira bandrabouensis]MCG6145735.1 3-phosphoserine/phosphohydroxythreonine transaminase [Leptospira bandrabouensis]MCG6153240.1 3-phosphoserine/phosphohydroxythreonine transaminase [Leptospira bandrabouensis]MCG6160722.1 3-phosphoserine/phosphohydroxythreonine transaminase [Leptospira bandrabouensis]MCG6165263.1 3-phosphoserine/phosphohydroxythreonine transaminase [Leptospira bandrabouensis]MCW7458650.1 3-phosphoserine/phosphohydroxy
MPTFTHRVFNFNAGPAMLPTEVMEEAQSEFLNYKGTGMSVMEMSHRGKVFQNILDESLSDLRELLDLPSRYAVVYFPGGATLQFSAIPFNYLKAGDSADFALTGVWAKKAFEEAKKFYPNVKSIFNGADSQYMKLPTITDEIVNEGAKYVYITSNNTIYGTRYQIFPKLKKAPLFADMTSELLSRKLPIEDFSVIFAGAQKNIGPSGLTLVIYDKEKLPTQDHPIPNLMNFALMEKNGSLYNTPPTYSIYIAGLVFKYLKRNGGLAAMEVTNERKAKKLYDAIDASKLFYAPVPEEFRSAMNVVFRSHNDSLDSKFLSLAEEQGFAGLKGYRDVGGFRASIYNAMPEEGVDALISFIKEFERTHG